MRRPWRGRSAMLANPIYWAGNTLSYSINQNVNYDPAEIRAGLALWESVGDIGFNEVAPGTDSDIVFVMLEELKLAFDMTADYAGLAIVITDDTSGDVIGRKAYVGLDASLIPSFDPARVAAHEVGHAFGFVDHPAASPGDTIYSYVGSRARRLGSEDIEAFQAAYGPSPQSNTILHGDGGGRVLGGAGDDTIHGEGGNDLVYGNQGSDDLSGGAGNDTLLGGQSDDMATGGAEDDLIYGNRGADSLSGGDGADTLYGGQDDDVLFGGTGDDVLIGNLGADTLFGGDGADLFLVDPADIIMDFDPTEGDRIVGIPVALSLIGSPVDSGFDGLL